MNNSELTRKILVLAIADSGLTAVEFIERKHELLGKMKQEDFDALKQRALNK